MPEQILHSPYVVRWIASLITAFEQIRRKTMSQSMGSYVLVNLGRFGGSSYVILHTAGIGMVAF